jgi:mono/diheme cytochrome c family protein
MKRVWRWIGIVLGSLLGLVVVAYGVVYVASERILQRKHDLPGVTIAVPTDPASIAEGRRQATIRNCFGCHGKDVGGGVMFDEPIIARIVAPDLTASVRRYSDAQLAVIIRNGLRPDGRSVVVMPAEAFGGMTDEDLGRTIAFLRSLPPSAGPGPGIELGPVGRIGFVAGKFRTTAQLIADTVPPPQAAPGEAVFGRYLATTICAQCHGTALRGDSNPDFTSPDLRIVAAYTPEAFVTLMRTGVALGGRTLGVMTETAKEDLYQLTDAEIAALYSYLHSLAAPN